MTRRWDCELRGGAYDGHAFECSDPGPICVVWRCGPRCAGHVTFNAANPEIVLRTAESYRRVERDEDTRRAVYEVGEGSPGPRVQERELVGASGGLEFVGA
jgi:hypothetical protein